jgi:hypothetical protein
LAALKKQRPKAELPTRLMPMLVWFREINDPTSIEQIAPETLSTVFGRGVRLRHATIEITNDPITTGIQNKLSWLSNLEKRGGALDGTRFSSNNELKSNLGILAFRRWGI